MGVPAVRDLFADLPADAIERVRDASTRIKLRMARTAADIVEIGRDLNQIKRDVGHGNFLRWIDAEFGMSEQTARRFMQVADNMGGKSLNVSDLSPSVLYALAADNTPDEVRNNVIDMAKAGKKVTPETVKELKEKLAAAKEALKDAKADLKAEKTQKANLQSRATEIAVERDDARASRVMLEGQLEQVRQQLEAARQSQAPPSLHDVCLHALRGIWSNTPQETRDAFLAEVAGAQP